MNAYAWLIAGALALPWAAEARAEEICGAPFQGQYAEEIRCATAVLLPDGSVGRPAMLDAMPDSYPWLFRLGDGGDAPAFTITVNTADASFTVLQFINGWGPYDSDQLVSPQFAQYGRARDIVIETADGQRLDHVLADSADMQFVSLPAPASGRVRVSVRSSYPGAGSHGDIVAIRMLGIAWESE